MNTELDIPVRLNGRAPQPLQASYTRDLVEADVSLLGAEAGIQPPARKRMRDRHHALARLIAEGAKPWEASAVTGYSISTVSILQGDPSFQELVAFYRVNVEAAFADFSKRAGMVTLTALDNLQELVENEEVPLTLDQNLAVVKTLADRIGYAPVQRTQNTNINLDLQGRLSAAKQRLAIRASKEPALGPDVKAITDATFSEIDRP